jgi:hypothetical protein
MAPAQGDLTAAEVHTSQPTWHQHKISTVTTVLLVCLQTNLACVAATRPHAVLCAQITNHTTARNDQQLCYAVTCCDNNAPSSALPEIRSKGRAWAMALARGTHSSDMQLLGHDSTAWDESRCLATLETSRRVAQATISHSV